MNTSTKRIWVKSILTGNYNYMDIPVSDEQLLSHLGGMLAQDAFPHLNAEQCEFLVSGITAEERNESSIREQMERQGCL